MQSFKNVRVLRSLSLIIGMAFAGLFVMSCTDTTDPGVLSSLVVSPNPATVAAGGTVQFTALGTDFTGAKATLTAGSGVVWSVASGGGTINASTGAFTASTTPGTYTNTIVATCRGISASATVVITPGPLATITVTPTPVTLPISATQQFTAVGKDAFGNVVAITPVWSATAGGTINATSGLFTAGTTPGTFTNNVVATSGSISGTASVTVTAGPVATITVTPNPATLTIGAQQTFTAVGKDAGGNVVTITPVWSVVNGGGTIVSTSGVFTAGTVPGAYVNTVKATQGTISGTATVNVTSGPITSIIVTPNPATLAPGAAQTFTAIASDASGNVVVIVPVWSVVNGGGTINSSTGVFTAGSTAGTFANTVKATSGSVSGTATVIVTASPGAIATIVVTPNPATVQVNTAQQFVAVARDANGVVVPFTPVWSVSPTTGGGTINSSTGLFTAGSSAGTFPNTVIATSGSISGTATVIVTTTPVPPPPPPIVNLGAAAPNGIMAGTTITCITGGIIKADIAISPGSTITGFGPCVVTGTQHLADALAAQAQNDLTAAYNTLQGLPCPPANVVGTVNIGGTTKAAGVYCSGSSIGVTGTLTLDGGGDANATFVFQAGSTITTAGSVVLINGAQAKNVYFVAGSSVTLGVGSAWQGNVIALQSITLNDNVTLLGRALARNGAVTLGNNNIITLP